MKLAILDDYQGVARDFADWDIPGCEVTVFREPLEHPARQLADFEIVCAMRERTPFDADLLDRLDDLKLLVTTGMKNASIDVEAARARGVTVCGTASPGHATAELAMALMLAAARGLPRELASFAAGGWQVGVGRDLSGATLGLIGCGRLGGQVAAMAQAFSMRVVGWSANLTDARCAELGIERMPDLRALLAEADFASVHLRLSDRTEGLIGAAELAAMKPDATLVNTSRAPIVDTAALVAALDAGRPGLAAIDVYDREPPAPDHPLRGHPRAIATPHIGYVTRETYDVFYRESAEAVRAWLAGAPVRELQP